MNVFKPLALFSACILFVFIACTQSHPSPLQNWMKNNGKVKVLCTTAMIADVVREIGKEHVDLFTLIQGESDPHSYQLVKGDDEKLARADLIFYNGLGLEHGPSLSERLKRTTHAFAVGDYLANKYPQEIIVYNGSVDPHVWMDVSLWEKTVPFICEVLSQKVPEQAAFFEEQAAKLSASLQALHDDILSRFTKIPDSSRYLVSAHEAFNYFVRAYFADDGSWQTRTMAPEGLAPESQLSTADIKRLVDYIIQHNVSTLFAESNVSRDSLKKILDTCKQMNHSVQIASEPLYVDSMGPAGSKAATYMEMLAWDAEVIARGLGGV